MSVIYLVNINNNNEYIVELIVMALKYILMELKLQYKSLNVTDKCIWSGYIPACVEGQIHCTVY